MAQSAKTQVAQTVKVARPQTASSGKGQGASGKVMFDTIQAGMTLPKQINLVIDAYFDLLESDHKPVSIQDISEKADLEALGYSQDGATIIAHYKLQIEGSKEWKHKQGCIKIGQFS